MSRRRKKNHTKAGRSRSTTPILIEHANGSYTLTHYGIRVTASLTDVQLDAAAAAHHDTCDNTDQAHLDDISVTMARGRLIARTLLDDTFTPAPFPDLAPSYVEVLCEAAAATAQAGLGEAFGNSPAVAHNDTYGL